jgi:hypothetical protein
VVGVCQVGTLIFLLLPMLEPLLFRLRSKAQRYLTYMECSKFWMSQKNCRLVKFIEYFSSKYQRT